MALRHVTITVYNCEFKRMQDIAKDERIRYIIAQEEVCPETKREHIQGYIQFKRQVKFASIQALLPPGTHIERAHGSPEENRVYCSKVESRKPGGQALESGEISAQGKRKDLLQFREAVTKGTKEADIICDDTLFGVWVKYPGLYKRLKCTRIKPRDRNVAPVVTLYVGSTGVGKTRRVFDEHKDDVYIKDSTKWWDGYEGQACILLDELSPHEHWRIEELLRLLDRYPYQGQYKGGYVNINSPFIEITSNVDVDVLYPNASTEQLEALNRRISNKVNL